MSFCPACGVATLPTARHCPRCGLLNRTPVLATVGASVPAAALAPAITSPTSGLRALSPGVLLQGRYRVQRLLGAGSFGRVYLAADEEGPVGTLVAIKEVASACFGSGADWDEAASWFKREVSALLTLDHPGIPELRGYWVAREADGPFYLAMEYIPGRTLDGVLRDSGGRIEWRRVVAWGIQLCGVLAYLHSRTPPVVFRDLKLSNVILDSRTDQPVLIDFGIARHLAPSGGTAVGTWGYVPYEQVLGCAEPRSDLYALGALLHALLTGRAPDVEYARLQRNGLAVEEALRRLFVPLHLVVPDAPEMLVRVVQRATAFDPGDRFPDAVTMAGALDDVRTPALSAPAWLTAPRPAASATFISQGIATAPAQVQQPGTRHAWSTVCTGLSHLNTILQARRRWWQALSRPRRVVAGTASGVISLGLVVLSVVWLAPPPPIPPNHQAAMAAPRDCCGARYFVQTGHNLSGPFLRFYNTYGGLDAFGYPRTEPFRDHGRLIQYTDRFLLQLETSNGHARRITVAPLGLVLTAHRHFAPVPRAASTPARLYFAHTRQVLFGPFLDFWTRHHGAILLGAPISGVIVVGNSDGSGRTYPTQWFENGRLEYHAELANSRYAIEIGLVGMEELQRRGWLP